MPKYAALLDVYSASDHSSEGDLRPELWQHNVHDTERWYEPGTFVTLFGFEASYDWPVGHHNVYYTHAEGAFWQIEQTELQEAWKQGTPGDLLTIPHHTGATMGGPPGETRIDWTIHDERFRTTAEIYSSHGHSEEWAPNHPLSLDVVDFTFQGPQDPGSYLQDAWLLGLKLGVIASSDNHASQPGKEGFGTMAVWAAELTREAVFEAIRQRRTYGTTGSRIYLEFFVNGAPMGSEIELDSGRTSKVSVKVLGTGPLRWIEVLKADLDRPGEGFSAVYKEWYSTCRPTALADAPSLHDDPTPYGPSPAGPLASHRQSQRPSQNSRPLRQGNNQAPLFPRLLRSHVRFLMAAPRYLRATLLPATRRSTGRTTVRRPTVCTTSGRGSETLFTAAWLRRGRARSGSGRRTSMGAGLTGRYGNAPNPPRMVRDIRSG